MSLVVDSGGLKFGTTIGRLGGLGPDWGWGPDGVPPSLLRGGLTYGQEYNGEPGGWGTQFGVRLGVDPFLHEVLTVQFLS